MAHFHADIQGQARIQVTRIGTKASGIRGHIRGWDAGFRVDGYYDPDTGVDVFMVYATGGSNRCSSDQLIATIADGVLKVRVTTRARLTAPPEEDTA